MGFWDTAGQAALQFGVDYAGQQLTKKDDKKRLQATQGPLYDQQIGLAGNIYATTPQTGQAQAQETYQDYLGLTDQERQAQVQDLQRKLYAKGQFGIGSYGAVAGTKPTPGVAMNPQLAALYAAQEGKKNEAAFAARQSAESDIDRRLNRANNLNASAQNTMVARSAPNVNRIVAPNRPSIGSQIASAGIDLLKQPGTWDFLKSGVQGLFSDYQGVSAPWWSGDPTGGYADDSWLYDI